MTRPRAAGRVEVLSYVHGPAPESDGVRTWPCRFYAQGDPGRSSRCWPGPTPDVRHVTPDPWVSEPALVLSDVDAGRDPWT